MRSLPSGASTEAASTTTKPINILEIKFGGAVGTKYYSDQTLGSGDSSSLLNASSRVSSWGSLSYPANRGIRPQVSDSGTSLELQDADAVIFGYFNSVGLQHKEVSIYQYFDTLGADQVVKILEGTITDASVWEEASASISFDVADFSFLRRVDIGTVVTRETLPNCAADDVGKVIPLVFGSVKRSPTISVSGGQVTKLVRPCDSDDTRIYVEDAEVFDQGTQSYISIEGEIILGTFYGNTFHVSSRGVTVISSTTSGSGGATWFFDENLSIWDQYYYAYFLEVTDPNTDVRQRIIINSGGDDKRIDYSPQILVDNSPWTIPPGTSYSIKSIANAHPAGAYVTVPQVYKFIVSDAAVDDVTKVEVHGDWVPWVAYHNFGADMSLTDLQVEFGDRVAGYKVVNTDMYRVLKSDTSIFGADHPVASIVFGRHPVEVFRTFDYIVCDVEGYKGDEATYIGDPVNIIKAILDDWVGVPAADIDSNAFQLAYRQGAQYYNFGFTLDRVWDSLELCADIAFQARCRLLWEDGVIRLVWIQDSMGDSAATISKTSFIGMDSMTITRTSLDDVYSEVVGTYAEWREWEDERVFHITKSDSDVEALYGRRVAEIDLWAHTDYAEASSIVSFYLGHWKHLKQIVDVDTFLPALNLQREDTVTLDWSDYFTAGQKARILAMTHTPGSGKDEEMDTIHLQLELPIGPGCSGTCEISCETSVETGCLISCETVGESCWQCETNCELACQLYCTTQAELTCTTHDAGCGSEAGSGLQSGCFSCETCETGACEVYCEASCQSSCEVGGCQIGTEADIQNTCNSCSPAIPDTLYVTLSGLAGSFATVGENAKHTLEWQYGCYWRKLLDDTYYNQYLVVQYVGVPSGQWRVTTNGVDEAGCQKWWEQNTDTCTPSGTYSEEDCAAADHCADTNSCTSSAGATCVVSTS